MAETVGANLLRACAEIRAGCCCCCTELDPEDLAWIVSRTSQNAGKRPWKLVLIPESSNVHALCTTARMTLLDGKALVAEETNGEFHLVDIQLDVNNLGPDEVIVRFQHTGVW